MARVRFSPEFRLVAACCRWPTAPEQVVAAAAGTIDWPRVVAIARRQRVEGLVHHALRAAAVPVPEQSRRPLADDAAAIARRSLIQAGESARLCAAIERLGAAPLVVKGSALALRAYETIAVKMSSDIDLLVAPDEYERAAEALAAAGYRAEAVGPMTPHKHGVWYDASGEIVVELHRRLASPRALLAGVRPPYHRCWLPLGPGTALPALEHEAEIAFVSVHGALHGWLRLKWLADFAALVAHRRGSELAALHDRVAALGTGRAMAQGMLLAQELLGLDLPGSLSARLRRDPVTRLLVAVARRALAGRNETEEHVARLSSTVAINLANLWLMPGWRYPLAELDRLLLATPGGHRGDPATTLARWIGQRRRLREDARLSR